MYTKPELIELEKVLQELNLTPKQLIYLGILIGTDYNPGGIKGIGPKKGLKLIKETTNYEKMFYEIAPTLNWKAIVDIYEHMPVEKKYDLEQKPVDVNKVIKLLVDKHEFSLPRVETTLAKLTKQQETKVQKGLGDFF